MQDGIGGEMNEAGQKQAAGKKPHGRGAGKAAVNPGKAKLNAAADETLGRHSAEIAEKLYQGFMTGDVTSARLLFALADGQIDLEREGAMERLCSLAEKLANEPQWEGETAESSVG
jgi:hypothetical protein